MTSFCRSVVVALALLLASLPSFAQGKPSESDIPADFKAPTSSYDYTKRVEMIPMRDGVKLYTVIVTPKGASHAPILLTRTPYNAKGRASRSESPHMA
ncbi:MAG TPA: CocE/NonD family hydrolase, partial [Candidatus Acidoferrum sp.]|nr:CocE/NonD family hydrolase [Candidatus Acidoferrum sp.]